MRQSWDEYFMNIAHLVKTRSTCLRRQVGAVAVSRDHRILGTGYNGPLPGAPHCEEVGCGSSSAFPPVNDRKYAVRSTRRRTSAILPHAMAWHWKALRSMSRRNPAPSA